MREELGTRVIEYKIGPFHPDLPGPFQLELGLDGEIIVRAKASSRFSYRGIEKLIQEHFWQSAVSYVDHIDPINAIFYEHVFCLAVEDIGQIEVPKRAQQIRVLVSEISRIVAHLTFIVRMARAVGARTMEHYVLRDRERFLDLMELLTGSRFSHNFIRYGGVASDISEGFIERVLDCCDLIRIRPKEYNDLFTFNQAFIQRTAGQAVISPEMVKKFGITGPNARATRVNVDVRKYPGYSGYQDIDFEPALGKGEFGSLGDAYDRFLVRLREIGQSVEIIKQVLESLEKDSHIGKDFNEYKVLPPGEAYARVESSRGALGCYLVSDGGQSPYRVQFRPPSSSSFMLIPELLIGSSLEDLSVYLSSLDLSISEVDR
jgi:NADH-quinone oxidoreductase subunit D